ncbi:MAG: hypothetical protein Q9208_005443 [Pyrenodesmia sp. 3 TL-2023]
MTELSFAKSFLSTLDNRPVKLPADYAADLKTLELKGPYTLPRYPSSPPMQPPSSIPSSPAPSSSTPHPPKTTTTLHLTSLRPPHTLSLSLPSLPLSTPILSLKQKVATELGRTGGTTEGIKILYARKPAGDSKTVGEVIGAAAAEQQGEVVEMQVLVVGGGGGGGGDVSKAGEEGKDVEMKGTGGGGGGGGAAAVAQGASGEEVMGSDAFWDDLRGWLMQRVRDEGVAGEVWGAFKRGWDERGV